MHAIPFLAFLSLRYQVIAYHHLVVKDHVLVGHAFQTIRTSDWLSCLQACSADQRCASYNVNKHKSCELNDSGIEDKCDPNESLIHSDGAIFQQLRKTPCQGVPCQNNGDCAPNCCDCRRGFWGIRCKRNVTCRLDFEAGIHGWVKTGTAFNNQPTYGDNPTARKKGQPANQQGDWWIGGYENRPNKAVRGGLVQGDGPQGTLTSPYFTITGGQISFLIGGSCDMSKVRAELLVGHKAVRNATGKCHETMTRRTWNVSDFVGQRARVKLVDFSSGGWGHINFDDLKGDLCCV